MTFAPVLKCINLNVFCFLVQKEKTDQDTHGTTCTGMIYNIMTHFQSTHFASITSVYFAPYYNSHEFFHSLDRT